ncbi:histidine phosphatase family protein [Clostridium sp. YIM B02505]|uniref:Histidine phosphatase family protein n=1 Tax=Clostridium yunnanense TaxID=2800325 RepID=A0ABS1EIA1_9CLOT|nr:histidine phosphatase family protein [Clostridium yunnanense]MBK1809097.1 histidine phosphatase family protein [Clostridium yunnanense]
MKTTLYLVRHGETKWNTEGRFQGCIDIELSDNGLNQAMKLKDRLMDSFDYVYTSPLSRAKKTAETICEDSSITPIEEFNLREINFGDWEGLTLSEIKETYSEEFLRWRQDELLGPICGGEQSIKAASDRAQKAILKIVQEHKGSRIVIVAHGGIIKAALIGLFEWKMNMYHKFNLGNTSINEITFNDNLEPRMVSINDLNHL